MRSGRRSGCGCVRGIGAGCGCTTDGSSRQRALQSGQTRLPCATLAEMQWKWKVWEHSAVKMACPPAAPMAARHIAQGLLCTQFSKIHTHQISEIHTHQMSLFLFMMNCERASKSYRKLSFKKNLFIYLESKNNRMSNI
jgi:hypothetical protein